MSEFAQQEVVAADGTSCAVREYPIAAGRCTTGDLVAGVDGTIIQPLPDEMETKTEVPVGVEQTCTWRWWPAALR